MLAFEGPPWHVDGPPPLSTISVRLPACPWASGICALVVTAYVMTRDILDAWYPVRAAAVYLGTGLAVGAGLAAVGAGGPLMVAVAVAVAWFGRASLRRRTRRRLDGWGEAAEARLAEWSGRAPVPSAQEGDGSPSG